MLEKIYTIRLFTMTDHLFTLVVSRTNLISPNFLTYVGLRVCDLAWELCEFREIDFLQGRDFMADTK